MDAQALETEFNQVKHNFTQYSIVVTATNYHIRSEGEDEYCNGQSNETFIAAASYRLALGVITLGTQIEVFDAYCTIRPQRGSGNRIFGLNGKKRETNEFLAEKFGTMINFQQQIVHPLDHLLEILPIDFDKQVINMANQSTYVNNIKRMDIEHIRDCQICGSLKKFTYFLTVCTLKMLNDRTLDIGDLDKPSDKEIWVILEPHEQNLEEHSYDCELFKSFFLTKLKNKQLKNHLKKYSDSVGIKANLLEYLTHCCLAFRGYNKNELANSQDEVPEIKEGEQPRFHTPYVTIVQSSGVGKTRSVLELRDDVILVYLCLRHPNNSGSPERSLHADFFDRILDKMKFLCYYLGFFEKYLDWLKSFNQDQWNAMKFDGLTGFLKASYELVEDKVTDENNRFWKKVENQCEVNFRRADTEFIAEISERVNDIRVEISKNLNMIVDDIPMFLFAYDEASSMIADGRINEKKETQFYIWRSSIAYFPPGKCFCVLLDTSSKVSNFAPARHRDESLRIRKSGYLLYPPFYWISFRGEFLYSSTESAIEFGRLLDYFVTVPGLGLSSIIIKPYRNILISRAMFVNYLAKYSNYSNWPHILDEIHDLACDKMKGGDIVSFAYPAFRTAITACLLDSVPLDTDVSENLVAHYMATLYHVSADRSFFCCKYVSEPVIGAAAASFLTSEIEYIHLVEEVRHRLARGELGYLSSTGSVAEIIACISLLYSNFVGFKSRKAIIDGIIDAAAKPTGFSDSAYFALGAPIPLLDFLQDIYKNILDVGLPPVFKRSFIRFNRWIRLRDEDIMDEQDSDCHISKRALFGAFQNQCAIILPPQFPAIDLAIPISYSDSEGPFEASEHNMTYIGVQVKGWKNTLCRSVRMSCLQAMKEVHNTTTKDGPKVLILVQVGLGGMGRIRRDELFKVTGNCLSIQIPSLQYLCRHQNLCRKLEELINLKYAAKNYLDKYLLNLGVSKTHIDFIINDMLQLIPKTGDRNSGTAVDTAATSVGAASSDIPTVSNIQIVYDSTAIADSSLNLSDVAIDSQIEGDAEFPVTRKRPYI